MNPFKFIADASPGGYQDRQAFIKKAIKVCAIFPGNFWTSLRIIGPVPVIMLADWSVWASFVAFLFFALTDFVDGKVARLRGEDGGSGVWLDPTADKIFILVLFWWFGCWTNNLFEPWLLYLLVAIELGGRLVIFIAWKLQDKKINSNDIKAKWYGKAKFALQILLGISLFAYFIFPAPWWQDIFELGMWIVLFFAAISVVSHIWKIPEPFRKK
jgi:phosphatidylglycerophosphate synthase